MSADVVETIDPATGKVLASYRPLDAAGVERALTLAHDTYAVWHRTAWSVRAAALETLITVFRRDAEQFAALISSEMGKSAAEARAELSKSIAAFRTLGDEMPRWRAARETILPNGFSVHLRPLGPVFGIMPWNFPLWQVVRFAVPAIMNGNVVLLKHASNVWGCAGLLDALMNEAFPTGVYQDLAIGHDAATRVIEDPRVRGVSLTGSKPAGQSVGAAAGRALKPCVLELGGSDAYVICDDADLDLAAEVCAKSRLLNAGQSCISAKRFIVTEKNAEEFTAKLVERMRGPTLAPMARRDLRDELAKQVEDSVGAGARVRLGGECPAGPGAFYPATVLDRVRPGMTAFDDELFGPVAAVIPARDEAEALALANRSIYGLGGAIFSRDLAKARRLAVEQLECGMAFVNEMVRSEAGVPFGGVKDSGVGREMGQEGAFAFTNVKTVFVPPTPD